MDLEIAKMDGESFKLSDYGIQVRDFIVESIEIIPQYGTIEGRSGRVDYGANYGSRSITTPFYIRAHDMLDYPLLRDMLYSLVISRESFYIRELRRPTDKGYCPDGGVYDDVYVGGKRYKVRLANTINLDQQRIYGFGELVFETTELPFAESIGTSWDIATKGIKYSHDLWSYGMGLLYDEESHKYAHAKTEFSIYNPSDIAIHPFEQELMIKIGPAYNSTEFFELENLTTGDLFRVNEGITNSEVVIDGANITINGLQALRKTNRKFISLAPGWNEFKTRGASSARVEFHFRFYYL